VATRLTLRMDERLIETAKRHVAARETSVSRMVAAYFEALDALSAGGPLPGDLPVPSRQHNAPRAPGARPRPARSTMATTPTHSPPGSPISPPSSRPLAAKRSPAPPSP
jgi:hypothetical protein